MKNSLYLFTATLVLAQGLFAEYPRDAAARFKMKHGITHPVVVQEAKAARDAKLEEANAKPEPKNAEKNAAGAGETGASNDLSRDNK